MRSTMLDRLRQGERLWIDQRRTPPACRCAPVCDRLAPECSDSRASQNSTSRAGAGGCVRPCWSRLARSGPRWADRWRRRERRDRPGLAPGSPSVLLRPAAQLPPFFLHERGITHRFPPGSGADRWPAPASRPRHGPLPCSRHALIVSYLCPVISSAARKLPRLITINSTCATSAAGVFNRYIGVPCVSPKYVLQVRH